MKYRILIILMVLSLNGFIFGYSQQTYKLVVREGHSKLFSNGNTFIYINDSTQEYQIYLFRDNTIPIISSGKYQKDHLLYILYDDKKIVFKNFKFNQFLYADYHKIAYQSLNNSEIELCEDKIKARFQFDNQRNNTTDSLLNNHGISLDGITYSLKRNQDPYYESKPIKFDTGIQIINNYGQGLVCSVIDYPSLGYSEVTVFFGDFNITYQKVTNPSVKRGDIVNNGNIIAESGQETSIIIGGNFLQKFDIE